MKKHARIFIWSVVAVVFAATAMSARAQLAPIEIKVDVEGETDVETKKAPKRGGVIPRSDVTQEKQLKISIFNRTQTEFANLRVNYVMFVRSLDSGEISVLRAGRRELSVPALRSGQVTSDRVSLSFTRRYSKKVSGQTVFVPASGQKFAGFGVQVLRGTTVLGEKFDPPELKAQVGREWPEETVAKKSRKRSE